jgi:replicative DNA helicase
MLQDVIMKVLTDILYALISLAGVYIVFLINKLIAKVKAEADKIADEKQRALVQTAIDRVNDLATKTVLMIEQTAAGTLRELVKDGKVDRAELLKLGEEAVNSIYEQLSDDTLAVLELEVNDVEKYIIDTVEAAVLRLKEEKSSPPSSIVVTTNKLL